MTAEDYEREADAVAAENADYAAHLRLRAQEVRDAAQGWWYE